MRLHVAAAALGSGTVLTAGIGGSARHAEFARFQEEYLRGLSGGLAARVQTRDRRTLQRAPGTVAQVIRRDVDEGRMPGAVAAISRKGRLVYHEAFGFVDKAANRPMTKDAIFALASMTKPMVAVATLMLAEEGACC